MSGLVLLFSFVVTANATELVINGGFETPELSTGTWDTYQTGEPDLGWSVDYMEAANGTGLLEIQNNVAGAPHSGSQHAELDSYHRTMIYQEIPTESGQTCQLTYWWSPRPGVADNRVTSYWNGVAVEQSFAAGGSVTDWHQVTATLDANSVNDHTRLEFMEYGPDDGYGMYLDDVSVVCTTPIVEPTGEILTPEDYETVSGLYTLTANYFDGDDLDKDIAYWAVRSGSCGSGTDVFSWYEDGCMEWDNENFSCEIDTTTVLDGTYCFVWNPNSSADNVRDTAIFYIDNDFDDDGIKNDIDNCPDIANPLQDNFDGDEFGDACDPDGDNDGVLDADEEEGCELDTDCDNDGVGDAEDLCPGTISEAPWYGVGTNRWYWNGELSAFESLLPPGEQKKTGNTYMWKPEEYSMETTQGCSCTDILNNIQEATGDDLEGHYKFGCSKSILDDWIAGEYYMETVNVPSMTASGIDSIMSPILGQDYYLKASGTYRFGDVLSWGVYGIADAEYAYRNDSYSQPIAPDNWTLGDDGNYPSVYGLDVQVDNGNVYWGDYSSEHKYTYIYSGTDYPVHFHIYDNNYTDNSGEIVVDILAKLW